MFVPKMFFQQFHLRNTTFIIPLLFLLARVTGINERLLGHYATSHRNPRPAQRQRIIDGIRKIGAEISNVV